MKTQPADQKGQRLDPVTLDVLLVEDDAELAFMLQTMLRAEGFSVRTAQDLASALAQLEQTLPQLVILDLNLPDGQGSALFRLWPCLRQVPTLVISARSEEAHKIALLDAGADDYLVKPFGVGELMARIRVALRHRDPGHPRSARHYHRDGLEIDLEHRLVQRDGKTLQLTPTEFSILACLVNRVGLVVTHRQLLSEVWGPEYTEHTHYLRVYIGSLRAKIEPTPAEPRYVLTEVGVGYRLVTE